MNRRRVSSFFFSVGNQWRVVGMEFKKERSRKKEAGVSSAKLWLFSKKD